MIMIESVDSVVSISSRDLWAEICSSLPHPDQNEDSNNAFADSFTDSYFHVESQNEIMDTSFQANLKPWAPLKDSEVYLASLVSIEKQEKFHSSKQLESPELEYEDFQDVAVHGIASVDSFLSTIGKHKKRRLMRIKGLSQEVTSKDMLHTLAQAKKECWDRFLQEKSESDFYMEGTEPDESTLEHLKRWLQPDKVAVSTEEVQYLIPLEARIEKQETEDESMAAEQ